MPSPWCATVSRCRRSTREIDALDNKIDGQVQLDLYAAVGRLVLLGQRLGPEERRQHNRARRADRGPPGRPASSSSRARRAGARASPATQRRAPADASSRPGRRKRCAEQACFADASRAHPRASRWLRETAEIRLVGAARPFFAVTDAFRISPHRGRRRRIVSRPTTTRAWRCPRAGDTIGAARRGISAAALTGFGKKGDPVAALARSRRRTHRQDSRAADGAHRRRRHHRVAADGGVAA